MRGAREKVWVVRAGDGSTLIDVLKRAGEDASAVTDGRVFIGKKRAARPEQSIRTGDVVRIGPAVDPTREPKIEILFDADGLVACAKPSGLPTVPDHAGASHSLVALVAKTIGASVDELRITSRLDRDVSGVVIFARGDAAEARLREARHTGAYHRRYLALASGSLLDEGIWDAPIGRASDPRLRAVRGPDEKAASTRWRKIATASNIALLAVDPITGRTHQIRLHASHAGAPLVGDRDYGGPARLTLANGRILALDRIALHATRVSVAGHTATVPPPAPLTRLWRDLGGDDAAWTEAAACVLRT